MDERNTTIILNCWDAGSQLAYLHVEEWMMPTSKRAYVIMLVTVALPRRTVKGSLLSSIHALLPQLATFPRIGGMWLTCECGRQSVNKRCKSALTGPKNGGREVRQSIFQVMQGQISWCTSAIGSAEVELLI